jgi:hypothetical protein
MIEVVEIPTTDLLLTFVESYRLAYRDEIDQKNERGINPFLGETRSPMETQVRLLRVTSVFSSLYGMVGRRHYLDVSAWPSALA